MARGDGVDSSLLREHSFCLFCGAPTDSDDGEKQKRPASGWRMDDEADRVIQGGPGFVKFWYGSGYAGELERIISSTGHPVAG
jgi:hypothetical protein